MAKVVVKKDIYGLYVRHAGFVFRPLFPDGYDPKNPEYNLAVDDEVTVAYKGVGASYAKIKVDGQPIFWMNHGSYIVPDGDDIKHLKSTLCILNQFKTTA